ncbi:4a-hydroxytetrahydrobiopterin dehydratase [Chroococcus sp. FPU101]|uniref:4a-hydroxytetrahydrobiopterin dehydratase n=1 Tax=Chroococcus sp. FPU101 TaxID=1974212 RepID=UPI001A8C44F6|nr:4a-hydroxytetrahydrobiopterin dehydratase [Chroococcus sp. FPU101]GFE69442.1 transcriptional coactivator/pterin dehydratase [Chroococcus sp. FPU101]
MNSTVKANPVPKLSDSQIQQQLIRLPDWTQQNQQLQRTFILKNFVEAIAFVNQLVEPSEQLQHHPDLLINYNRVTVTLSTHDAGGITQKDFDLANIISQIAETRTGTQK